MRKKKVIAYIGNNNNQSNHLLGLLDEYEIGYTIKNVSENRKYMRELQAEDIYGIPALFIDDKPPILGFQKNEIKYTLGYDDNISHYSSLFEGFQK